MTIRTTARTSNDLATIQKNIARMRLNQDNLQSIASAQLVVTKSLTAFAPEAVQTMYRSLGLPVESNAPDTPMYTSCGASERNEEGARAPYAWRTLGAPENAGQAPSALHTQLIKDTRAVQQSVHGVHLLQEEIGISNTELECSVAIEAFKEISVEDPAMLSHWAVVEKYGEVVVRTREMMSEEVCRKMDKAFCDNVQAENNDWLGYSLAKGYHQSARYMTAELEKGTAADPDHRGHDCYHKECAICMEEMNPSGENRTILHCKHGFCTDCIDMWKSSGGTKCPMCNTAMAPPQSQPEAAAPVYRNPNVRWADFDRVDPSFEHDQPRFISLHAHQEDAQSSQYQSLDADPYENQVAWRSCGVEN